MADRSTFDDVVSTPSLLRLAYLLTGDAELAERLLQISLVRAWRRWNRLEVDPELHVRDLMAATYVSRWRRWTAESPSAAADPLWASLGQLSRRQRAVVVLRHHADLSEADIAGALGMSRHAVAEAMELASARLGVHRVVDITAEGR